MSLLKISQVSTCNTKHNALLLSIKSGNGIYLHRNKVTKKVLIMGAFHDRKNICILDF